MTRCVSILCAAKWPVVLCGVLLAADQTPFRTELDKKNQTLNEVRDLPMVAIGETARLTFQVSPLSGQGLLSQQTRDALKAILRLNGGQPIVHIRAISAGNGDVRRISQIVADVLQKGPLPSVSIVQAGRLQMPDAQIVLEAISLGKKAVNPNGLVFHAAETVVAAAQTDKQEQLLEGAADRLAAKMKGNAALFVSCFVSDLEGAPELQRVLAARFPGAVTNLVQSRRLAWQLEASCEGVSRGGGVGSDRFAFSGTQPAFGPADQDAMLAAQRLDRALSDAGAPRTTASLVHLYLVSPAAAETAVKNLGAGFPSPLSVEGAGPASAAFALDAIAPVR